MTPLYVFANVLVAAVLTGFYFAIVRRRERLLEEHQMSLQRRGDAVLRADHALRKRIAFDGSRPVAAVLDAFDREREALFPVPTAKGARWREEDLTDWKEEELDRFRREAQDKSRTRVWVVAVIAALVYLAINLGAYVSFSS
jgi:hypothetical protein